MCCFCVAETWRSTVIDQQSVHMLTSAALQAANMGSKLISSPPQKKKTHGPNSPYPTEYHPTNLKPLINSAFCGNRQLRSRKRILAAAPKKKIKDKFKYL